MTNATIFGSKAKAYREARPGYPGALFDWIAEQAPAHGAVWDCGTGSGQAAISLSERFDQVFATDISADQIAAASERENIQYSVAPAETSGLADGSVDAVTVATALHWFDFDRYWDEVRRVLRPGGLFFAWSYAHFCFDGAVEEAWMAKVRPMIDPFWGEGNRIIERGYDDVDVRCPFDRLETPLFKIDDLWPLERILTFGESWSATMRLREDEDRAADLDKLIERARAKLGPGPYKVEAPIHVLAARV